MLVSRKNVGRYINIHGWGEEGMRNEVWVGLIISNHNYQNPKRKGYIFPTNLGWVMGHGSWVMGRGWGHLSWDEG